MNKYCGAFLCDKCSNHKGMERCFCGWSLSGRNGYTELLELSEVIEPEDY